jgi:hypothetical protein
MRRLAVFALISGCSGGIDYDHFADTLIDARCTYFVRCGLVANGTECTAFYQRVATENPSTNAAIDAGKLVYHADVAQDCLDAYAALSCDSTQQPVGALDICNNILTGTVAMGGACAFDQECESDNCVVPSCTAACCTGTCGAPSALPSVGQPCTAFCAGDAYCGADSICHAPLADGAACMTEPCAYGLYCAGRTATLPGRCKPLPHLGEACEGACAEVGAICDAGTCVGVGVRGDPCTADAQCSQFYQCAGSQCALLPTLGMPCRTTCYEAAYCDGTTCIAQKPNGASCLRGDECDTHYCERGEAAGTCSDLPVCF